jgi:L-fuconolactonase
MMTGTDPLAVSSPHIPVRPEWLRQWDEPVLEPELEIIDAHHHLWDRASGRYLFEDLLQDAYSGHNVRASVYVQCKTMFDISRPEQFRSVGEVEFANGVAALSASGQYGDFRACAAIVAGADLTHGLAIAPVLEEMIERAGPRLRGIRNTTAWHADPAIVTNPNPPPAGLLKEQHFRQGVSCLGRYGLSLDIWAYHTQLGEVLALAKAFPDLVIVLDHVGGPLGAGQYQGRRDEVFSEWADSLSELSRLPNVVVKIGGLGMSVGGFNLHQRPTPPGSEELAQLWEPYIIQCIELFGTQRCMFESNFPVDKGMYSYKVLWNAFKRLTKGFSQSEKADLFSGTATRIYRI